MTKELLLKNLSVPKGVTDVVIDTDAQNEIDGQFAISYLLKSKKSSTQWRRILVPANSRQRNDR